MGKFLCHTVISVQLLPHFDTYNGESFASRNSFQMHHTLFHHSSDVRQVNTASNIFPPSQYLSIFTKTFVLRSRSL